MFYSHSLLSKKGPLGNIWIAAFCLKKLKKEQINGTDITSTIDKIMPEVQISYRVLAQLLFGIVKIFSKKVDYLYHDCILAAKEVIHTPKNNLSSSKKGKSAVETEVLRAQYNDVTITLPEHFELDAFDLEVSDGGFATDNTKPYEEFILQADFVHDAEERTTERNQGSFSNEWLHREMDAHIEFNSDYLTPMDDFPTYMMDIDLENSEYLNSNSLLQDRGKKAEEGSQHLEELETKGSQHLEELETNEILGANISVCPCSQDEQSERHMHQKKLQEGIPSNVAGEVQVEEERSQVKRINLHTTNPSDMEEPHQKYDLSIDSGLPSPNFAVTTPAKRETSRVLKKRKKNLYDETIVLPNEILKKWIHDTSDLVCKRRKVPCTSLDAWKVHKLNNLQQIFMEPLIPCVSLKLKATVKKYSPGHSPRKQSPVPMDPISIEVDVNNISGTHDCLQESTPADTMAQADQSELRKQSPVPMDPISIEVDVNNISGTHDCLQESTPADTMAQADQSELPKSNTLYQGSISEVANADISYEGSLKESHSMEISNSGTGTIDLDLGSAEKGNEFRDGGWSTRTREVAQYLFHRFLALNDSNQKKIQSLAQMLEGHTRAKCARFFYETLTLKSHGCIDVKQDNPYEDITISATPKLEALLKNP